MRGIGKAGGRGRDLLSKPSMELPQKGGEERGVGKHRLRMRKKKWGGGRVRER